MLRRFSISFSIFSMFLDLMIVSSSMLAMTFIRPSMNVLPGIMDVPSLIWLPPILYLFFPLIWVSVFSAFSIYDGRKFLRVVDELSAVTIASVIAAISQAGILFLSFREVSRALFLSFSLFSFLFCIIWRLIARAIFHIRKDHPNLSKRILVVGEKETSENIIRQLRNNQSENVQLVQFLPIFNNSGNGIVKIGKNQANNIRLALIEEQITDLIISIPYDSLNVIKSLTLPLENLSINIWVAMDFLDLTFTDARIEDFSGIPMMDLRAPALSEFDQLIKRGFDLLFATILLIIALPIMAIVSLLIIVNDGLPVLFRQQRVGENGRVFWVNKFRTMVKNAEALSNSKEFQDENGNYVHKIRNDPRVTKLGKFLRRTSLDELPQLFNVLAGEMSMVGPRPELPFLVDQYQRWQRKRLTVPPGITGWWQVNGRSDKMMHLHAEDDIYYVQNYSIWLDIQIMIRTVWVVLIGKGSF